MFKSNIRHEHLKRAITEMLELGEDNLTIEVIEKVLEEIRHSSLIIAGDVKGDTINAMTVKTDKGDFCMLFTDMDEYRKMFPDFEFEADFHLFNTYKRLLERSELLGFIINFKSECFILPREMVAVIDDVAVPDYSAENAYTTKELKSLKDSIDNSKLEGFLEKPENAYDYEGLFELISSSTLLTLMLSKNSLKDSADDGIIAIDDENPQGRLFIESQAGDYATAYTSEEKISMVDLPANKFSQVIDFSYMVNFVLYDDLDGIIINPRSDNIILPREVLLEFSQFLDVLCRNPKLNTATSCMFLMEA